MATSSSNEQPFPAFKYSGQSSPPAFGNPSLYDASGANYSDQPQPQSQLVYLSTQPGNVYGPDQGQDQPVPIEQRSKRENKCCCGFSRKCCIITWIISGIAIALLVIGLIVGLCVYYLHTFKQIGTIESKEFECTKPRGPKNSGEEVFECFTCDISRSSCSSRPKNQSRMTCEPGQVCYIEKPDVQYGRSSSSVSSRVDYEAAGCTFDPWVGCHYKKKSLGTYVGSVARVEIQCHCAGNLCNTWGKCGCKVKYDPEDDSCSKAGSSISQCRRQTILSVAAGVLALVRIL